MDSYTGLTDKIIDWTFYLATFLFVYLLVLVLFYSPVYLGRYRWLLLQNCLVCYLPNLLLFLFKPVINNDEEIAVVITGGIRSRIETSADAYFCVELLVFSLFVLAYSLFLTMVYRYRQLLPPYGSYWLSETSSAFFFGCFVFLLNIVPSLILLRLARIGPRLSSVPGTILAVYSGKQNHYFYGFLAMVGFDFATLAFVLVAFHGNLFFVLKESRKRFLPATFEGQQFVYFAFSIQMAIFVVFVVFPALIAFLAFVGLVPISPIGFERLIAWFCLHSILELFSVLYFIKGYRERTLYLVQTIFRPFLKRKPRTELDSDLIVVKSRLVDESNDI